MSCRIRRYGGDLDRYFHGNIVRRGPDPGALQRYRPARLSYHRDAHQILVSDHAAGRVAIDPAWAGKIDLEPGMGVAPGVTVVIVSKMQVSGHEPHGETE